jgi:hypothetical protein
MRYIVYMLLVANVLYLGWNLSQDKSAFQKEQSFPPIPDGVHSLVLLSEIERNIAPRTDVEDSTDTDKQAGQLINRQGGTTADEHEAQDSDTGNVAVTALKEGLNSAQVDVCKVPGPFDDLIAADTVWHSTRWAIPP